MGGTGDVAGKQVGGELHAFGVEAEEAAEGAHEFGFAQAGQAFEEEVAAGEHAGEHVFDEGLLSEEDLAEVVADPVEGVAGGVEFVFGDGGVGHGVSWLK